MAQNTTAPPSPVQVQPAAKPGLATPPPGWSYLAELAPYGPADIFHIVPGKSGDGPATQMQAHTKSNVGILVRDADVALTPATTLKWQWNVAELPSKLTEDVAAHHDYLSIAVQFDNGKDLTYMWSTALPPGTGFHCPLPGWTERETHVVIRSGAGDLGKWLAEERSVQADYAKYVGGPLPSKIVHVWLIANSIIQKGEGDARFADISLGDGSQRVQVF
ncbi:MAG TPA: DUF3047 domain-containing protein [Rhizomicrobium sp.]|nr:DUF3047 domain-containing protein [Rhizomicrobium sp.]